MTASVVMLPRPWCGGRQPGSDPAVRRAAFERARSQMMRALSEWLSSGGEAAEVSDEVQGTALAMHQIVQIMGGDGA